MSSYISMPLCGIYWLTWTRTTAFDLLVGHVQLECLFHILSPFRGLMTLPLYVNACNSYPNETVPDMWCPTQVKIFWPTRSTTWISAKSLVHNLLGMCIRVDILSDIFNMYAECSSGLAGKNLHVSLADWKPCKRLHRFLTCSDVRFDFLSGVGGEIWGGRV